jgi:tellurite resistance protein
MALVFYRTIAGAAIPEVQRPTWFIFLVPPSLIYANGHALWAAGGMGPMLDALFFCALLLAVALLLASWTFLAWPFSPAWWAFTFPLDAFATAAAHYARGHADEPWAKVAGVALIIAVLFVLIAIYKSLRAAFAKQPA